MPHNVLNARYHEQEAYIVSEAGAPHSVTIATNMAGRGTDIQLGGNFDMRMQRWREELGYGAEPSEDEIAAKTAETKADIAAGREKVLAEGGLYVLGTERHESRRIDNQPPRPHRPPGRPRPLQVLPVLRGRPAAHLRRRAAGRDHGTFGVQGRARRSPTPG